jgi:hypothetical protein
MNARVPIGTLYDEREYGKALRETMLLADQVNGYVDLHKPWELAKKADAAAELHEVCSICIEAFRLLTIYLKPVLPALAGAVEAFLRTPPLAFDDAKRRLGAHAIGEYRHLMQRVDAKVLDALFEAPAVVDKAPGGEPLAPSIELADFAKVDLRIARIVACEGRRRLDQAAAADARCRRGPAAQRLQRHPVGLRARRPARQADRDGREPRAPEDEVRSERRHGAGRLARRREERARHLHPRTLAGRATGSARPLSRR